MGSVAGCLPIMASIRLLLALLLVACLLAVLVDARRKPPKKPSRPGKKPSKPAKKPAKPAKPGRPAKPGKPGKPGGSKPKPKPTAIFEKYTKKKEGGLCWWDTTRKDCAICKSNTQPPAVQCGFPMHNYCYKRSEEGCPWVAGTMETSPVRGAPLAPTSADPARGRATSVLQLHLPSTTCATARSSAASTSPPATWTPPASARPRTT